MWVALSFAASLAAAMWWARRRLVRVDVVGESMHPTLNHGDVVLIRRARPRSLRPGRIVVAEAIEPAWSGAARSRRLTGRNWVVKRIAAVAGTERQLADLGHTPELPPGTVFLLGDNRDGSRDSRHVGPWPADRLLGVMVCRLRRVPSELNQEASRTVTIGETAVTGW